MSSLPDYVIDAVTAAVGPIPGLEPGQLAEQLDNAGLLRRPPRPVAEHGTSGAYERCRNRPQGSCEQCKAAKRRYVADWKDRRDPQRARRAMGAEAAARREWDRLSATQRQLLLAYAEGRGGSRVVPTFIVTGRSLRLRGLVAPHSHVLTVYGREVATAGAGESSGA